MKKKLVLLVITSLIAAGAAKADYAFSEPQDFTGEAFFQSPSPIIETSKSSSSDSGATQHTVPPVKQLRLLIQDKFRAKDMKRNELAPTASEVYAGEIETSEYASKDLKDEFEDMTPDGFEADEESVEENQQKRKGFFRKKDKITEENASEDIILDCDNVDYDTPNYLINAKGNVNVEFVKQATVVKADSMVFDRMNNTIKAEGNVQIIKNGQTVTGDYIFVDMNEENALIENPLTRTATIEIKAKKGYVYGDKIVQEQGSMTVDETLPIEFHSATRGPRTRMMYTPKDETLTKDMSDGMIKFTAKEIKVTQKGDLETVAIKKGRLFKGDKTLFKVPSVKFYTNKNHDYGETNIWEIGSYRGLGIYTGPGFVFELPKGSVLKAIPMLNYKSGFGIGGYGRFSSGTNKTIAAYGTATSKFIVYGKQKLDDNLFLQYGMNSYMDEWFLGRRRPKYGASLVYNKSYSSDNFLIKNKPSTFRHRLEGGYFQDLDFDGGFEKIHGTSMGTTRFRYMADAQQTLFNYDDKENLKSLRLSVASQLSAAVYGTGDTQVIGRLGPNLHMQYKRWMQDIGYFFSVYEDNTPMPAFDAYRYGKQNLYLREYIRLNRYLTLAWFSSINLTNDSPNDKTFQENAFYLCIGPDDTKFNIGYDFIRENLYCTIEMKMDAKGTQVEYDTFEIKQDKKAKKTESKPKNEGYKAPVAPKVLQRAVVEDVKAIENVL